MATFGGFFRGCSRQWTSFAYTKMRSIYNDNINSCTTDLSNFGDASGMRACFIELGLNVPKDDVYFSEECNTAIDVVEIF